MEGTSKRGREVSDTKGPYVESGCSSDEVERGLQTAVVSATLPVFFPADKDEPYGWQDPAQWDAYGKWMQENGLLKRPPNAARALTNEFLPGQGLDPGVSGLG